MNSNGNPIIGVHLDLKGVAFRPSYLPQLLDDLASQGVNALLVEYEDIFPLDGLDIATDQSVAWSRQMLREFLAHAKNCGIQIIPLQQCLGHLEFLLGWDKYRAFALDFDYPSTLDITNYEAKEFIFGLLRQILQAHPESRFIHVGMDEAHALVAHAAKTGSDATEVFFGYLEELCGICEAYGKTPIVFSDMLEDHITSRTLALLEPFKTRVILNPWDYNATGASTPATRFGGNRISRKWMETLDAPSAPLVTGAQKWIEDLEPEVHTLVNSHRDAEAEGELFLPLSQVDFWTRRGFRVLGASACRASKDGPLLPFYNLRKNNIRAWSKAIERNGQIGQIATTWARGTSWCPPNFLFDGCWFLIGVLGASMGAQPAPFFVGIEKETIERIFATLGNCRESWRVEESVAQEMTELLSQLQAHQHEWRSSILMVRVLGWQRDCDFAVLEVEDFHAAHRPVDSEWQRRLDDQARLLREASTLQDEVLAHFEKRYHGAAFEEWMSTLFDLRRERLESCRKICQAKRQAAQEFYARLSP